MMKTKLKNVGKGAGTATVICLLAFILLLLSKVVFGKWWPHDEDLAVLAAVLGGIVPTIYFIVRRNWWAVLGSTGGYTIALIILGMLLEIVAGGL